MQLEGINWVWEFNMFRNWFWIPEWDFTDNDVQFLRWGCFSIYWYNLDWMRFCEDHNCTLGDAFDMVIDQMSQEMDFGSLGADFELNSRKKDEEE